MGLRLRRNQYFADDFLIARGESVKKWSRKYKRTIAIHNAKRGRRYSTNECSCMGSTLFWQKIITTDVL